MTLFANLISEAGYNPKDYPRLSGVQVNLIDGKDRIFEHDPVFEEPIFANNNSSYKKFGEFLSQANDDVLFNIPTVQINDDSIIINPHTPEYRIFLRF